MTRSSPLARFHVAWCAAALAPFLFGCGATAYALTANSAAAKLEAAETLNAEKHASYEYHYARIHLEKAAEEASHADYGDALDYAETAEEFADRAIRLAKRAHALPRTTEAAPPPTLRPSDSSVETPKHGGASDDGAHDSKPKSTTGNPSKNGKTE